MLQPRKTKYLKVHRAQSKGKASKNNKIIFGSFGLKSLESCWITSKQIEASRRILSRSTKKIGKFWIKIFPDLSITKKPISSRMGSGKGSVKFWVAAVKKNHLLFELDSVTKKKAVDLFKSISYKLPVKTQILIKN